MSPRNSSCALSFLLTSIPGMAPFHRWLFFPCCLMCLTTVLGNGTILLMVGANRRLHQPLCYLLLVLATADLGLALPTLPTVLRVFWFGTGEDSFPVCLTQMFYIRAFSFMEPSVLLAMAFDRYVAICCPLRYSSPSPVPGLQRLGWGWSVALTLLLLICLLPRLPFCRSHVLPCSYCLHQDVIWLACTDSALNSLYGLTLVLFVTPDAVLITLSYTMIVKAVVGTTSREEQTKALNMCVSHVCAVFIFYIPMVGLSIIHQYRKNAATLSHNIYLCVPPVLNLIIYSVKNKPICKGLLRLLCQRLAWPGHGQQPRSH